MLASAVGGLLTRTLVSSQVECVTENVPVYSFHMLMQLLCDFNAAKLFLGVSTLPCLMFFLMRYHNQLCVRGYNTVVLKVGGDCLLRAQSYCRVGAAGQIN